MPDRNEYAAGTPSWVDLATPDAKASKKFYAGLFGWDYDDQDTGGGGTYSLAQLRDRSVAGLMENTDSPPVWSIYVTVDDVDATTAKVAAAGGTVLSPGMDVMDAGRMAVIVDPLGAVICVWQAKNHIGSQINGEPGSFLWAELITPDVGKAVAFYNRVFGWEGVPFEGSTDYTVLNNNGEGVGGAMLPQQPGMPSFWLAYFNSDDVDGTVKKATKAGATTLMEPHDIPTVGRIAVLTDPKGATFAPLAPNPQQS